ncbi:MAG: cbb3-type cytochrome c oxidase subunit II [Planctomycetota bacterium]|jgi:cytochrome c oxidase cbb3-type subunit 2
MAIDIHTSHRTMLGIAAGVYVVLVFFVAILPAREMEKRYPPQDPMYDELVARGHEIYVNHGCVYCHTQQIRGDTRLPLDAEGRRPVLAADRRFGLDSPTTAEEYVADDPPLLGTQRTGPDLTAVGTRLPDAQWHYWHLYDPRAVSPDSNMPALPWLFYVAKEQRDPEDEEVARLEALDIPEGMTLFATYDGRALVEYLISRTRPESTR